MTTKHFIGADNKLNVEGIILAGSANFKSDLEKGETLDERVTASYSWSLHVISAPPPPT
jgi:peptide subunit release factor 1 (eRF1)